MNTETTGDISDGHIELDLKYTKKHSLPSVLAVTCIVSPMQEVDSLLAPLLNEVVLIL